MLLMTPFQGLVVEKMVVTWVTTIFYVWLFGNDFHVFELDKCKFIANVNRPSRYSLETIARNLLLHFT